jgi:hypothetical protein
MAPSGIGKESGLFHIGSRPTDSISDNELRTGRKKLFALLLGEPKLVGKLFHSLSHTVFLPIRGEHE